MLANETKHDNVVQFNKDSVYKDIEDYLNELEVHAKTTRQAYEKDIKDYFHIYKEIDDIRFLTMDDLQITKKDLEKYRQKLIKLGIYSNATINRKIKALKSLIDSLMSYGYELNNNAFSKWKWLHQETESYGTLTLEEGEKMALLARNTEKEKAEIKYFLIKMAIRTSYRISDLLKLEWKDIVKHNEDIYLIRIYEKKTGKYAKKPITREFYEELLNIKDNNNNKIFNISTPAVNRMMENLRKQMGFSEERNIVFHSFRNIGIGLVLTMTNDIVLAAKQGNHSDINTTYKHYIEKTENYDLMAGMLIDKELNYNILEHLTKEELLQVMMKCSKKVQYEIITEAEKMIKE